MFPKGKVLIFKSTQFLNSTIENTLALESTEPILNYSSAITSINDLDQVN